MGVMLKVNDLHVYYGSIHAVKGVSFEVNEGEVVTLIGANGAGKSTVLNTVSGLLHPRAGSIEFEGTDLKGVPPHKILSRGLAQVPEGRHVFLQMTVEENLEMGAYTQPKSGIADGIADVYRRFPRLEERRKQTAGTLSGGEQQMLAMGRALMSKPKLLMLDEPSMGLAPILVEQIFDIVGRLGPVCRHPAVLGRTVNYREVELVFCSIEVAHQVEHHLVHLFRATVRLIYLINNDDRLQSELQCLLEHETGLRHRTLESIDEEEASVCHVEHALNLTTEVRVSRSIKNINFSTFPIDGNVFRKNCDTPLTFEVVSIKHFATVILTVAEKLSSEHHLVYESCLAMVDMGNNCYVSNVLHCI